MAFEVDTGGFSTGQAQTLTPGATPTFAGLTLSGMTVGSVLFAGTGGLVSQDNANFFWDDTNNRLAIGMAVPQSRLHLAPSTTGFRNYNSYTDASNGEWYEVVWATDVLTLGTNKNGTGSARNLIIEVGGTSKADFGISSVGDWYLTQNVYANGMFIAQGSMAMGNAVAIPAGGTTSVGYRMSTTANFGMFFGSGAPSLSAAKGSLYLRSDGSGVADRAYINTNGSTTWTAIATAG